MPARRTDRRRRPRPEARRPAPEPRTDGPLLELDVERIAHGGVAVARHEGRVVFVADAIPGERVVARVHDDRHDRFWRADAVEVLDASPDRRPHPWAEAGIDRDPAERAGGAEFGHIAPARQRALKAEVLADAMRRFAELEIDARVRAVPLTDAGSPADAGIPEAPADSPAEGWRTRVRLHVDAEGRVGPYAARSHRVVPVTSLPLAVPELEAIAPLDQRFRGADRVDLVAPSGGDAQFVVHHADDRERGPRPGIRELVGDREFRLDRDGFWQVHRGAARTLTRAVQELVDDALFDPRAANLDLYGGVGLLAAALGDRFGETVRITSVEADTRATEHAAENLADWVGARAVTSRVDRYLAELAEASAAERARLADATIVLDPPRQGAGREVVDGIAALRPRQLVYVACDPVALARDVGLFRARGYELAELAAFDLFPDTHHLETVARLTAIVG